MSCHPTDRLRYLQQALHLSTIEFADALRLPPERIRRLLRPHRRPTVGLLARVQRCFPHVNPLWLLTGEGEVFFNPPGAGNAITNNYGTATQTIHFHFDHLPTNLLNRTLLIGFLESQLSDLKSAA